MVGFVICGLEHSGTTLVSELLRQVPGYDAGFEVGVLLGATPRDFPFSEPYAEHMLWGWGINYPRLFACCKTDDFDVFYRRLAAGATTLRPGTHTIFDKTPRYLADLAACMSRSAAPFVVTYKDPRSTVYSDFKSAADADFEPWFDAYQEEKLGYMRLHYQAFQDRARRDPRVCLVRLEDLCLEPRRTCERLFAHVGVRFDLAYLTFRRERYQNTRIGSIGAGIPFEHLAALGPVRCARIARVFSEFGDWFYD